MPLRYWIGFWVGIRNKKESYLPTLQALPGKAEFKYLLSNTQEVLLVPIPVGDGEENTGLVLGGATLKSFSPRDVACCQL